MCIRMKICVKEIVRDVCFYAHVGVIPVSVSIHELRESSKGS